MAVRPFAPVYIFVYNCQYFSIICVAAGGRGTAKSIRVDPGMVFFLRPAERFARLRTRSKKKKGGDRLASCAKIIISHEFDMVLSQSQFSGRRYN